MTCPPFCDRCGGNLGHPANGDWLCDGCKLAEVRAAHPRWSIEWSYGYWRATHENFDASWEGEEDGYVGNGWTAEARSLDDLAEEMKAVEEDKQPPEQLTEIEHLGPGRIAA